MACLSLIILFASAASTSAGAFAGTAPGYSKTVSSRGASALHVATFPDMSSSRWEEDSKEEPVGEDLEYGASPFFASLSMEELKFDVAGNKRTRNLAMGQNQNQGGPLAPLVVLVKDSMGQQKFNFLRGKVISLHTMVIRAFVNTADTPLGDIVLKSLFLAVDTDGDGLINETQLGEMLHSLGFTWIKERQIKGIFERANVRIENHIDIEEFVKEAPKTLSTNLIKLAKSNGGKLGFLA
ncbi:expressed unknown protein [Seminavis robusta]|uniref:EF-hand domain-containing protein n=1 Tax=Seminavis robusta TaxID=568900 RepID=A0A9N8HZY9_9STRA|nr:expressed unknown protein [Seminavis robusta]|eukprot:Sro2429_g327400.1 n/a (239) ;mRNA; r:5320-6036